MRKRCRIPWALAFSVVLITGSSPSAKVTGLKIVHESDRSTLKFADEQGNVLKELSLVPEKITAKINDNRKKREWDGEREIMKTPIISGSREFAVMNRLG